MPDPEETMVKNEETEPKTPKGGDEDAGNSKQEATTDETGNNIKRSDSMDLMLAFIEEANDDLLRFQTQTKSKNPALHHDETWDYTLKTLDDNMKAKTIWISDSNFLQKMGIFNSGECEHEIIKITCPCSTQTKFSVCLKCHTPFCSNKCFKLAKDGSSGTVPEESATDNPEKSNDNSVAVPRQSPCNGIQNKKSNSPKTMKFNENQLPSARGSVVTGKTANLANLPKNNTTHPSIPKNKSSFSNNYNNQGQPRTNERVQQQRPHDQKNKGISLMGVNSPQQMLNYAPPLMPNGIRNAYSPRMPLMPMPYSSNMQRMFSPQNMNIFQGNPALLSHNRGNFPQQTRGNAMPLIQNNMRPTSAFSVLPEAPLISEGPSPIQEVDRILRDPHGEMSGQRTPETYRTSQKVHKFNTRDQVMSSPTKAILSNSSISEVKSDVYQSKVLSPIYNQDSPSKSNDEISSVRTSVRNLSAPNEKPTSNSSRYNSFSNRLPVNNGLPFPFKKSDSDFLNQRQGNIVKSDCADDENIRKKPFIAFGVPTMVGYSYGDSVFDFYVWSSVGCKQNENIKNYIDRMRNFVPLKTVQEGMYCLAKYRNSESEVDVDGWYRGCIKNAQGSKIVVTFIDFGNDEVLDMTSIAEIPSMLMKIPPSAIRISLGGFKRFKDASDEQFQTCFTNYILDKWILATIYPSEDEGRSLQYQAKLEIKHEDQWFPLTAIFESDSLGEKLPFQGSFFERKHLPIEDRPVFESAKIEIQIKISHVKDLNDFYVIPLDCLQKRIKIMSELNSKNIQFTDNPKEKWHSSYCLGVAQREDGQWARAKIIEVPEETDLIKIHFVDFGDDTTVEVDKLKTLPKEYVNIPQLAYRCSLAIFPTSGSWDTSDPDFQILVDLMSDNKYEIYMVVFALENYNNLSTHIVEVFFNDRCKGLTKSLQKNKLEQCYLAYEIDLDVRNKMKEKKISSTKAEYGTNESSSRHSASTSDNLKLVDHVEVTEASQSPVKNSQPPTKSYDQTTERKVVQPPSSSNEFQEFSADVLKPAPPLRCFERDQFTIIDFIPFNRVFITPERLNDDFLKLQDEIKDWLESTPKFLRAPSVNSVVVAKFTDNDVYRVIVKKIISHEKVEVYFIDLGSSTVVEMEKLKPVNRSIMEYHPMCYEVVLPGIEECPKLLLSSDFQAFMEKSMKGKYLLQPGSVIDGSPCIASLIMKGSSEKLSMSERILQLQIWDWERHFTKGITDIEILTDSAGEWPFPAKSGHMRTLDLPLHTSFQGQISRLTSEGVICLINIKGGSIHLEQNVLENQIERFISKVVASPFFPVIEEVLLIRPKNVPELKELNLRGIGKWNRCHREQAEYYRNLDQDEVYPVDSELSKYLELRKMCPEFLRVPIGLVQCVLRDSKPLGLKTGQEITFVVDSFDKKTEIHTIKVT